MLLIVIQSPRASTYARAEVTNQCISRHNQHVISVNEIHMQTFLQKKCNSMKWHYPYHWGDTRKDIGCPALEKSLERKLSETQKRHYAFTNKKDDCDLQMVYMLIFFTTTFL